MEETWKDINSDPELIGYVVSNTGIIKKKDWEYTDKNGVKYNKKGITCKTIVDGRCPHILICCNGNYKRKYIDFIVATEFIPNPNKYQVVSHIDHDPENNSVDNLYWDSYTNKEYNSIENLPNEEWKFIENSTFYMISNMGRVKSIAREKQIGSRWVICPATLLKPSFDHNNEYLSVGFSCGKYTKTERIHTLVAKHFVPNSDPEVNIWVDHINRIRSDNRAENLRWVSAKENARNGVSLEVIAIYEDGSEKKFSSIREASEATGYCTTAISNSCNNKSNGKIKFRWMNEKQNLGQRNRRKGNNFEREICKKLKDVGYNVVTSRSESKTADNDKKDIIDLDRNIPCNIQAKYTVATPNYFKIRSECSDKELPFVIIWKKADSNGKHSPGTIAMIPEDFFYELLSIYNQNLIKTKYGKEK